jgi:hypothetical protein
VFSEAGESSYLTLLDVEFTLDSAGGTLAARSTGVTQRWTRRSAYTSDHNELCKVRHRGGFDRKQR